jgi:CRISPR-associated protein Csm3
MADNQITLKGRVFFKFNIDAVTGLHIGGSDAGIQIGGVDKTVIRDVLTNRPYIPGSSLKGKMRSLSEKYNGKRQNQRIGQGCIHSCEDKGEYDTCNVCQVFGLPGERDFATPGRLIVRDTHLHDESAHKLEDLGRTDLPYTEVKTEVSIDRVTSAANPRQLERVPAGVTFGPAEMVYTIYDGAGCDPKQDVVRLAAVIEGMQLLEDDYLGGSGSRGSGKVSLSGIEVKFRGKGLGDLQSLGEFANLAALRQGLSALQEKVQGMLQ